jgi:hypothetical protein
MKIEIHTVNRKYNGGIVMAMYMCCMCYPVHAGKYL